MAARLMSIVAEGKRERLYLDPIEAMEETAFTAEPEWRPDGSVPERLTGGTCYGYGLTSWDNLFTDRQLVALTTLSDLVSEVREMVLQHANDVAEEDSLVTEWLFDDARLTDGGAGTQAYADSIATFLGLAVGRQANRLSSLTFWNSIGEKIEQTFARQALPMVWDFCEANPFSNSSGNFNGQVSYLANVVAGSPSASAQAAVIQQNAAGDTPLANQAIVATDPPYYDNIGYADLSDFFYIWQRRALRTIWPDLYRRVLVPKDEELVAASYRHGGKDKAEQFFMEGIGKALANMYASGRGDFPVTIYYAFKQSEVAREGLTSPGWATFLQALVDTGYSIIGTWPVRSERDQGMKTGKNVLASSIVLVCRKRPSNAPIITRREFVAQLRVALPDALAKIRVGGVGPVDVAQASLGPGMGVFTAVSKVLEPDDNPMTVRTAIALINQIRDEISGEEESGYDPHTRFCIDWFEAFGFGDGKSGAAIGMANPYDVGIEELEDAGVIRARGGTTRLLGRNELPADWDPSTDKLLTVWECAQHLARALDSPLGGIHAAAILLAHMPPERSEAARMLAYRLFEICERKNRAAEAQMWNILVREWPALESTAAKIEQNTRQGLLV